MLVRSLHFAANVPEADATIGTLYYPADASTLDEARLTGLVDADAGRAPWPLVIVLPGINVAPDAYRWLAVRLVEQGCCVTTFAAIGSLGPAGTGITPGLDMSALAPEVIGTVASATAVVPVIDALGALGEPVSGLIDFSKVVVGGHSAGGTVALHNSRRDWVPGLIGVFAYGAHTMTSTSLGHEEATVIPIPADVPVLLLGGEDDRVIAASRDRYRSDDGAHDPISRTFDEAIGRDAGDCWLVEIARGNHFTICDPIDETSGRSFLETDLRADDADARATLAAVIGAFVEDRVAGGESATLRGVVEAQSISRWARR